MYNQKTYNPSCVSYSSKIPSIHYKRSTILKMKAYGNLFRIQNNNLVVRKFLIHNGKAREISIFSLADIEQKTFKQLQFQILYSTLILKYSLNSIWASIQPQIELNIRSVTISWYHTRRWKNRMWSTKKNDNQILHGAKSSLNYHLKPREHRSLMLLPTDSTRDGIIQNNYQLQDHSFSKLKFFLYYYLYFHRNIPIEKPTMSSHWQYKHNHYKEMIVSNKK